MSSVLALFSLRLSSTGIGVVAFLFSGAPLVVGGADVSTTGGGRKVRVGVKVGSSEQTWRSRTENVALQLLVMALPFQCASTSEYRSALLRSSMSSPRGTCLPYCEDLSRRPSARRTNALCTKPAQRERRGREEAANVAHRSPENRRESDS